MHQLKKFSHQGDIYFAAFNVLFFPFSGLISLVFDYTPIRVFFFPFYFHYFLPIFESQRTAKNLGSLPTSLHEQLITDTWIFM